MKLKTVRELSPVFITLLILFEIVAYTSTIPRPQEPFFQLYTLGATGMAGIYYPNNSSFIQPGEVVDWNLGVVNDMGSLQYVSLRVKLGNQTINPPNDTLATSSPSPLIAVFNEFIPNNGTWQMSFVWQIVNYTTSPDGHIAVHTIAISNSTYAIQNPPTCQSINSCEFRIIFELWVWDTNVADFQFGWTAGGEPRIAWLQLWFQLSSTVSHR